LPRQPAGKREISAVAVKVTATLIAMGTRNATRRHHGTWRRLPWSWRLRLWPRSLAMSAATASLRMMPMVATAVSPLSAGRLSRQEAG